MKMKNILRVVLYVGATVISIMLVVFMSYRIVEPTPYYVYAKDFREGDKVTREDLKTGTMPKGTISAFPDAITDANIDELFEQADGINTIIRAESNVKSGHIALISILQPGDTDDPFININWEEYAVVSLPASYNDAFGGHIEIGDMVALIHVREVKDDTGAAVVRSNKLKDNYLVYSVTGSDGTLYQSKISENQLDAIRKNLDSALTGEPESTGTLATLNILCTLTQAEEIYAKQKTGSIKFAKLFSDNSETTSGYQIQK